MHMMALLMTILWNLYVSLRVQAEKQCKYKQGMCQKSTQILTNVVHHPIPRPCRRTSLPCLPCQPFQLCARTVPPAGKISLALACSPTWDTASSCWHSFFLLLCLPSTLGILCADHVWVFSIIVCCNLTHVPASHLSNKRYLAAHTFSGTIEWCV